MALNCGSGLILDRGDYTVYAYSMEWLLIPLGVLGFGGLFLMGIGALVPLVVLGFGELFLMDTGPLECNCPDRNEDILKGNLHPSLWLSDC